MKRQFRNFLVTIFLLFGFAGLTTYVLAASEPPKNDALLIHENTNEITKAITESKTGDNLKATGTGATSSAIFTATWLMGPQSVTSPQILDSYGLPQELRHGLLDISTSAMFYAFINGPSDDIPHQYALMLLPDQFKPAQNTAYAVYSPGPDENDSTYYLGEDMLGINKLWGVSFTIAMGIVVLVLIVAGFMIMFRSKLGGQVTVTVMMALQNIVVGTVLALASYAMGAFFLNLSKYLIILIAKLFESQLSELDIVYFGGPGGMIKEFLKVTVWGDTLNGSFPQFLKNSVTSAFAGFDPNRQHSWFELAKLTFNATAGSALRIISGSLIGLIARLVMAFAITIATLKVFWAVLQTYIKMIIDIVLAPIVLVFTSLPGKQAGFSNWLKRMFQNALAVPVMFAFMNVAAYLSLVVGYASTGCGDLPSSSLITCITSGTIPAGTSTGTDWLIMVIGPTSIVTLVMLNMVPTVPTMLQEMLAGKGDYSKSIGAVTKSLQSIPGVGGIFK